MDEGSLVVKWGLQLIFNKGVYINISASFCIAKESWIAKIQMSEKGFHTFLLY